MASERKEPEARWTPARADERSPGAFGRDSRPADAGQSILGGGELPIPEQEEVPELLGERSDYPVPFGETRDEDEA
jgi:hypothetical protein